MAKRGKIEQALVEHLMVTRTLVQLKHRLAASRELNEKIETERAKFLRSVHRGELPEPRDLTKVIDV